MPRERERNKRLSSSTFQAAAALIEQVKGEPVNSQDFPRARFGVGIRAMAAAGFPGGSMRYNFMVLSHTLSSQFKSRFGIQDADYLHTRTLDPLEVKFIALRISCRGDFQSEPRDQLLARDENKKVKKPRIFLVV